MEMFTILLHSSKTMRPLPADLPVGATEPMLLTEATRLATYVSGLTSGRIQKAMGISRPLGEKTRELFLFWLEEPGKGYPAMDMFLGDIYSGLQVADFNDDERSYADESIRILSGLYGVLRPLDLIRPYRLEMGYKFFDEPFANLYRYWGHKIAESLPDDRVIIDLSAIEYTKAVFPCLPGATVIKPRFLTVSPKSGEPVFVTVHAKVARGAFAHWLVKNRIDSAMRFPEFNEIGYAFDPSLSSNNEPVFVCQTFKGLGLSVRLTSK